MTGAVFVSTEQKLMDFAWLCGELGSQHWFRGLDPARFEVAMQNSICFGLYLADAASGRRQIGFARVVTDGATFSSVMDVFVERFYRKLGYGRLLMRTVLEHPSVRNTTNIISSRDAVGFYRKFGYEDVTEKVLFLKPTPPHDGT